MASAGQDYNVYVPVTNALRALGKTEALNNVRQRFIDTLEKHLQHVPEDARARILPEVDTDHRRTLPDRERRIRCERGGVLGQAVRK